MDIGKATEMAVGAFIGLNSLDVESLGGVQSMVDAGDVIACSPVDADRCFTVASSDGDGVSSLHVWGADAAEWVAAQLMRYATACRKKL